MTNDIEKMRWIYKDNAIRITDTATTRDRVDGTQLVGVRKILRHGDNEPIFGPETPMKLRFAPRIWEDSNGPWARFRMEVLSEDLGLADWCLVATALDYSIQYYQRQRFRKPNKRRAIGKTPQERAEQETDPWITGNYCTAAFDEPSIYAGGHPKKFRFSGWALGMVQDYESCFNAILQSHFIDKRIKKIMAVEEGNTVFFRAPNNAGRKSTKAEDVADSKSHLEYKLRPDEIADCLSLLSSVAIPQSLSGPIKKKFSNKNWENESVSLLARFLWDQHCYNWLRTKRKQEQREIWAPDEPRYFDND